jgi:hypothetical protein
MSTTLEDACAPRPRRGGDVKNDAGAAAKGGCMAPGEPKQREDEDDEGGRRGRRRLKLEVVREVMRSKGQRIKIESVARVL